jgi:riboflavin biosynthesis pyrimidine reductase
MVTGRSHTQHEYVEECSLGIEVWRLPEDEAGNIDLRELLRYAGRQQIVNLLVEGGAEVFSGFIRGNLVDKYLIATAPKLLGAGKTWFVDGQRGIDEPLSLRIDCSYMIGGDLWVEAYPR